jgi:DNA excision repair protein ERCC-6
MDESRKTCVSIVIHVMMIVVFSLFTRVLNSVLESWWKDKSRVLIFSQSRAMLDILEMFVRQRRYVYLRMDGETAMQERMKLIDSFNRNEEIFVFLLTTKVGNSE